jgi:DNA polymerase-1
MTLSPHLLIQPKVTGFSEEHKIMVVASHPTYQEVMNNRAFSSPDLALLESLFISMGVHDVYLTYLIKEHVRRFESEFSVTKKFGVRVSELYKYYRTELRQEIEKVNPDYIVTLGDAATYAVLDTYGVDKKRGSLYPLGDRIVMPLLQPSSRVTNYLDRYLIQSDIRKLRDFINGEIRFKDYTITIAEDSLEVVSFLEGISDGSIISFDIETSISTKEILSISFSVDEDSAYVIPFLESGRGLYWTLGQEMDIWRAIAKVLENPMIVKVTQYGMFDCYFLGWKYRIITRNVEDTMLMQGTAYHEFPKGLDMLASLYTTIPYYKDEGKEAMVRQDSNKQFWEYNGKDTIATLCVYKRLLLELERSGNLQTYRDQIALFEPFFNMSIRGIRMDKDAMSKLAAEKNKELEKLKEAIHKEVGHALNPNSPKQLQEYFYGTKRYKPYVKKGKTTTDVDAMKRLKRRGDKVASLILEYRSIKKLVSTYLEMDLDFDNRVRGFWKLAGSKFGRLACSKTMFNTGANLQNQPADMKGYMLPDEGYIGYSIDLEQAENRIVAYLSEDPKMIEAFESGIDIHSLTAALIFNSTVDRIKIEDKNNVKCPLGDGKHTKRYWGKKANHGLNYRLGYKSFSMYYELPEKESKVIVDKYHQAYPSIRVWHDRLKSTIYKKRMLENPFGRKMYFFDFIGDELLKSATSCIPQSTVPAVINRAIVKMHANHRDEVILLNQVHDSIDFEIPKALSLRRHAELLLVIKSYLEQPINVNGHDIVIPIAITLCPKNFKGQVEIKSNKIPDNVDELETLLRQNLTGLNEHAK